MKKIALCLSLFFAPFVHAQDLAQYVNPFVGTGGHGHTFPGAVLPFGMVQLSPDTRVDDSWDGCSGYHYSDPKIYGFSHTHLSGTGCPDWGDFLFAPMSGEASIDRNKYSSAFSHKNEKAAAGYYSVKMDNGITAELTSTLRTGIHRYSFPAGAASVVLDLTHRDKTLESYVKVVGKNKIEGFRRSEAWAKDQYIYFAAEFSEDFNWDIFLNDQSQKDVNQKDNYYSGKNVKAIFSFPSLLKGKALNVKVAISSVSCEGAWKNLQAEATHWDFEAYRKEAVAAWNKELTKITVESKDTEKLKIFYTALYHCMIHPSLAMDVDNQYRGRDNQIHTAKGFTYYSVFSLWDTFRALNPLFTIFQQKRTSDFMNTFLVQYEQGGRIPMWELSGNETDCMVGYHGVSVVADAIGKGINSFDKEAMYKGLLASATHTAYGIPTFNKNGFLQTDDEHESVSKTLEYAYDDWCIAQVAGKLGHSKDQQLYLKRALGYRNLYDLKTGFLRPRKNGNWLSPFDPTEVNNHFTEANCWQYSFFVPQDVEGLIRLHGGDEPFAAKLDELFTTSSKTTGRDQADITGLIGQYAHGNEPSHHMAYLYNYAGKPYKAQERVWQIMNEFYKNDPDGLIGNEDCGQMSGWFVISSLGLYQVCPGNPEFVFGVPLFDKATVALESGKTLTISRNNSGANANYVSSVVFNGTGSMASCIPFSELMKGGTLQMNMTSDPNDALAFGAAPELRPHSSITSVSILPAPVVQAAGIMFKDKTEISFGNFDANSTTLYYTHDGSVPTRKSTLYKMPFTCDATTTIQVRAYSAKDSSTLVSATFYKKPNNWTIRTISVYSKQYNGGGDEGLIDGIHGTTNWRKGDWQGYQAQNFECIVDLGKQQSISRVSTGFLQDTRAWIIFPTKVEYYVSPDGINFELVTTVVSPVPIDDYNVQIKNMEGRFNKTTATRFVKVKAYTYGKLPAWHIGAGGDSHLFVDEIMIR